jgi:signal transduction histidine kinase
MKRLFLSLFTLVIALRLFAQESPVVRVTNPTQAYDVLRPSFMLEVPSGTDSVEDLLRNPAARRFVPYDPRLIKTRFSQLDAHRYGYWFSFQIANETNQELLLRFVYSGTETIDVYEIAGERVVARHKVGSLEAETVYPFRKSNPFCPLLVQQGQTHRVLVYQHGVYTAQLPMFVLTATRLLAQQHRADLFYGLYYGFILIIILYNLVLFVRLGERDNLFYTIWVFFVGLQVALYRGHLNEFLYAAHPSIELYGAALAGITGLCHVPFTLSFLRLKTLAPGWYRVGLGLFGLYALALFWNILDISRGQKLDAVPLVAMLEGAFSVAAGVVIYRRGFRPALYYVLGNLVFFASLFFLLSYAAGRLPYNFVSYNTLLLGSGVEILLFTLALAYKINLFKHEREQAVAEQIRLLRENERLVSEQNATLEAAVRERTGELRQTLRDLEAAQAQLIQAEKLASLGELTAGIAHEIQNPLNFVTNFAEVSVELVDELRDELAAQRPAAALDLTAELTESLQKITQHGQRASAIVRSMLEHSRVSPGERQPTDLNALADEYLRLAYHGLHGKDKAFRAHLVTDFDPTLGLVNVVPQDISRVLLNLFNNAFYAVCEKQKQQPNGYQPTVSVSTKRLGGWVELCVRDNGTGIPENVRQKIFQPFFTTKPSGEGTGLGLSLSYDIVTKGHGGTLTVESTEGEGTEFTVRLPA